MPAHNHDLLVSSAPGGQTQPDGAMLASSPNVRLFRPQPTTGSVLATDTIEPNTGGAQPHDNLMPFLCVNFIIALVGIFPSRQ